MCIRDRVRAAGDRVVGEEVVELGTAPGETEGREGLELGPREDERLDASAVDAEALVMNPAGLGGDVDAHPDQGAGATGGESVAAHLVAGEGGLVEELSLIHI